MSRARAEKSKARRMLKKPKGKFHKIDLTGRNAPEWMSAAYGNNRYTVMVDNNAKMTNDVEAICAMVQRHDDKPIPNHWREMQSIKNELFGAETVAVEYYPAESDLVDDCNIYWMWIMPKGVLPVRLTKRRELDNE